MSTRPPPPANRPPPPGAMSVPNYQQDGYHYNPNNNMMGVGSSAPPRTASSPPNMHAMAPRGGTPVKRPPPPPINNNRGPNTNSPTDPHSRRALSPPQRQQEQHQGGMTSRPSAARGGSPPRIAVPPPSGSRPITPVQGRGVSPPRNMNNNGGAPINAPAGTPRKGPPPVSAAVQQRTAAIGGGGSNAPTPRASSPGNAPVPANRPMAPQQQQQSSAYSAGGGGGIQVPPPRNQSPVRQPPPPQQQYGDANTAGGGRAGATAISPTHRPPPPPMSVPSGRGISPSAGNNAANISPPRNRANTATSMTTGGGAPVTGSSNSNMPAVPTSIPTPRSGSPAGSSSSAPTIPSNRPNTSTPMRRFSAGGSGAESGITPTTSAGNTSGPEGNNTNNNITNAGRGASPTSSASNANANNNNTYGGFNAPTMSPKRSANSFSAGGPMTPGSRANTTTATATNGSNNNAPIGVSSDDGQQQQPTAAVVAPPPPPPPPHAAVAGGGSTPPPSAPTGSLTPPPKRSGGASSPIPSTTAAAGEGNNNNAAAAAAAGASAPPSKPATPTPSARSPVPFETAAAPTSSFAAVPPPPQQRPVVPPAHPTPPPAADRPKSPSFFQQQLGHTAEETLQSISTNTKVPIAVIRSMNPSVAKYRDTDVLPASTELQLPVTAMPSYPIPSGTPRRSASPLSGNNRAPNVPQSRFQQQQSPMTPQSTVSRQAGGGANNGDDATMVTPMHSRFNNSNYSGMTPATAPKEETLATIAERTGVDLATVMALNPHLRRYDPFVHVLPVGTTVHIPATNEAIRSIPMVTDVDGERERAALAASAGAGSGGVRTASQSVASTAYNNNAASSRSQMGQTDEQGETLLDVARNTETSIKQLLKCNPHLVGYPLDKPLKPGTHISLPDDEEDGGADEVSSSDDEDAMMMDAALGATGNGNGTSFKKQQAEDDAADAQLKTLQQQQINNNTSASAAPPLTTTSSVVPSSPYEDTDVNTLHRIGKHYGVAMSDLVGANVALYDQFGGTGTLANGTRVHVPLIKGGDVVIRVFTVGVGLEGEEHLFGDKKFQQLPTPTTLAEVTEAKKAPSVDLVRSWATLDSHTIIANTFPKRLVAVDPSEGRHEEEEEELVDETLWTVSEHAMLPPAVIQQLMGHDPTNPSNRRTPSLDAIAFAMADSGITVALLRAANPQLPKGYPSVKALPFGFELILPQTIPSSASTNNKRTGGSTNLNKSPSGTRDKSVNSTVSSSNDAYDADEARMYAAEQERAESAAPVSAAPATTATTATPPPSASTVPHSQQQQQQHYEYADGLQRVRSEEGETLADVATRFGRDPLAVFAINPTVVDDEDEVFEEVLPPRTIVCLPASSSFGGALPTSTSQQQKQQYVDPTCTNTPTSPPRRYNNTNEAYDEDYNKFQPDMSAPRGVAGASPQARGVPAGNGAAGGGNNTNSPSRRAQSPSAGNNMQPTKTILANGRDTVRDICNEHFLTEDQLRRMNPFMVRYYAYTVVPKNTCVVLETLEMAQQKYGGGGSGADTNNGNNTNQYGNSNNGYGDDEVVGEMFEGRRVYIVRSPTRGRNGSPNRRPAASAANYPRSNYSVRDENTNLPINTLETIAQFVNIPEKVLRRRNPALSALASSDELPKNTIVELDGDVVGPYNNSNNYDSSSYHDTNGYGRRSASHANNRSGTANMNGSAMDISLNNRALNRRQVVRVMGHKAAVIVGQRYFNKWRLFATMFSSQKLQQEVAMENEREQMRVALQAGQIKEADLRRRVAELRIALDSTRPASATATLLGAQHLQRLGVTGGSPMRGAARGYDNNSMANYSTIATHQQYNAAMNTTVLAGSPYGHQLTYSEARPGGVGGSSPQPMVMDNNSAYMSGGVGGATGMSPSSIRPVQQLAAAPALNESRNPHDISREVGGTDIPNAAAARKMTPLRDQPTLNDRSVGSGGAITPTRVSPLRRLLDAHSSMSPAADGNGYYYDAGFRAPSAAIAAGNNATAQKRSLGLLLNGLRVTRAIGAAAAAGIQANDTVIRVGGQLVSSGTTFKLLVDREKGPKVSLTIQTPTGHIFTTMLPLVSETMSAGGGMNNSPAAGGRNSPNRNNSPMRYNNGFPVAANASLASAGTAVHANSNINNSLVAGPGLAQMRRASPLRNAHSPHLAASPAAGGGSRTSPYRRTVSSPKGAYNPRY